MKLLDANVLLNAVNADAPRHHVSRPWLERALSGPAPVAFAWVVLLAFIRISTRPGIFARPLSVVEASEYVEGWLGRPNAVVLAPTSRHHAILSGLLIEVGTAGNLSTDAHLAALAIEHGAEIWSFDRDFARFRGLRAFVPGE